MCAVRNIDKKLKRIRQWLRGVVIVLMLCCGTGGQGLVTANAQKAQTLGKEQLAALGDSLTIYARAHANVQKVVVKRCERRGGRVTLRTNATLSYLALSEADLDELRGKVSEWVLGTKPENGQVSGKSGSLKGRVLIYSEDKELGELVPSRFRPRREADKYKVANGAMVSYPDAAYETGDGLQGRNIALWASHGKFLRLRDGRWIWQRARLWTTVEDLFSFSFTNPFLVPMLEQSGAVVLQPRERDMHREERVTYTEGRVQSLAMPMADKYALYVRYKAGKQNTPRAVYTIGHQGVVTRVEVNQQMGGDQWLYIGTYGFGQDSAMNYLTVEDGSGKGMAVAHEGVKIGGGVGVSGNPRFMEGARYWLAYNSVPDSVYTYEKKESHYLDDLVSRGRWVNYLNECQGVPVHLALAVHTDAGVREGDSIVGTLAIYSEKDKEGKTRYKKGGNRVIGRDLADYVQTQVVADMRRTLCANWARRELKDGVYAESRIPHVPTLLVEMLSHQNQNDMRYGLDGRAKFIISRAIYKGVLRFLHEQDGTPYVVQPLPVRDFAVSRVAGSDSVQLTWKSRYDSLEVTAEPTYYVVYTRAAGSDWDNGWRVDCEQVTLPVERGKRYDFVVRAGNAGGVSMESEQLSAYIDKKDNKRALIVNGFTRVCGPAMMAGDSLHGGIESRALAIPYGKDPSYIGEQIDFDKRHEWKSDDDCGYGMCANDYAGRYVVGNTFDYPAMHGEVLAAMGYSYVSCSLGALDRLVDEDLVDVVLGKEAAGVGALSSAQRKEIARYLHGGGRLILSGAYIGSGTRDAEALTWARTELHYMPQAAKASKNGLVEMQLRGRETDTYQLYTEPNEWRIACEAPDAIEPVGIGTRVGSYADSFQTAGVATGHRILVLPFMPESVCEFETLWTDCIRYLEK